MRIAIKYGLIITAGVAIWVLADHLWLNISRPGSGTRFLTPLFFNLLQLFVLFIGIRTRQAENRGSIAIKEGLGTGMEISAVYGLTTCIFFLALYRIMGSKLLENESASFGNGQPERDLLLKAFAGVFFGALFGGLLYSTVISLFLRNQARSTSGRSS